MKQTQKAVIFDFDGTIADTFSVIFSVANDLSEEFGYQKVNLEDVEHLRGLSARQIIKEFKIPVTKVLKLIPRVREETAEKMSPKFLFEGIVEEIKDLSKKGYYVAIISTNSKESVFRVLKKEKELIKTFVSVTDLFGKDKAIKSLLKENGIKLANAVYIGDEARDVEAAKKAHVKSIAVTWGYNKKDVLKKEKPDKIAESPGELGGAVAELI